MCVLFTDVEHFINYISASFVMHLFLCTNILVYANIKSNLLHMYAQRKKN